MSPGENLQGPLNGTPVWHFQDDAVTGDVRIDVLTPGGLVMPQIFQTNMSPTHYLDGIDGPGSMIPGALGISGFSKDLAFEIYTTVPEPASLMLAVVAIAALGGCRRRRE